MERNVIWTGSLALLGVLAIALAAGTFPSAVSTERGSGPGSGDSGGGFIPPPPEDPPIWTFELQIPEVVTTLIVVLLIASVPLALLLSRETALRRLLRTVAIIAVMGVFVYAFSLLLAQFELPSELFGSGLAGGSDDPVEPAPLPLSSVLFVGLLVLAIGGTALALVFTTRSESEDNTVDEAAAASAVGRAAGRAADRLESDATGDVENEVYRAWREMTGLLELRDPETHTPGEFAVAAVGAGMDEDDVRELTRLFEDIRYGGDEPTDADERRAIAIFREIESTYTEGER